MVRPGRGRVAVSGVDTNALSEEDVWRSVALVSQDVYLRDGTLRENLNYGREDATDDELRAALHIAGLDELFASLPDKLDTAVGQRGSASPVASASASPSPAPCCATANC